MKNEKHPAPSTEPSVWDYFISKLKFWESEKPASRGSGDAAEPASINETVENKHFTFPWFVLAALLLALIAQFTLEPSSNRTSMPGIVLYAGAAACLVIAVIRKEWQLAPHKPDSETPLRVQIKPEFLLIGGGLAILAFLMFGSGLFGFLNTLVWFLSILFIFLAFWDTSRKKPVQVQSVFDDLKKSGWTITISRWTVIVLAVIAVVLFFNFHRLDSVPPEMVSDQAEKLLDINDVLHGYTPVYFPRNTGREALHFYLTAAYIYIFQLDISFLNLKVVAVFANLLTLFFMYLLGKEFGNRWVGLGAVLFAGMAYWPLLFTRLALRIPYYPLFVAPVLYFMLRGFRRQNIHDILWTGFFLGLGLHGYTPFRIVPIFVVIGVVIYLLHQPAKGRRLEAVLSLILIASVSLILFIPLLRYWLSNPDLFAYRAFSRLTGMEVGFQMHPLLIFLKNFWDASVMFFWDNGVIWAHSIPGRPALEVVSGALYFLGIAGLLIRYIRKRNWMDLFLLISIPLMLMPSILSLAYPGENPSLNRSAGAVVPVFVVIGLAFETVVRAIRQGFSGRLGKILALAFLAVLLIWSASNNYTLVFDQYYALYRASSWNTSEIGRLAAFFIETIGSPQTTYVVGYPHWVDSRLVAINSGYPGWDYAIFPDQISETANDPRAKLFFLNTNDADSMQVLLETFPNGVLTQVDSEIENKDFMVFFVPPSQGLMPDDS